MIRRDILFTQNSVSTAEIELHSLVSHENVKYRSMAKAEPPRYIKLQRISLTSLESEYSVAHLNIYWDGLPRAVVEFWLVTWFEREIVSLYIKYVVEC